MRKRMLFVNVREWGLDGFSLEKRSLPSDCNGWEGSFLLGIGRLSVKDSDSAEKILIVG
jgi:hypothetical protein